MCRRYEEVIGLEVHVELGTKSKIFCGCSTAFGGAPNTHSCPVCMGMPGTLPVLNRQVLEYALAVGLAMGCKVNQYSRFDRKNYFYPDNPQNYQISQLYFPICKEGLLEIEGIEGKKAVGIHEIHMEEDAGKLIHGEGGCGTLVDYNRAGVPLIEIVSGPDMHSAREVISYLEQVKTIIRYLGASDCKLQEGSMRVDVNLSLREWGVEKLGTRTEMKNLNSFKAIARAIEGESKRQTELLESGQKVTMESRRWDDSQNRSYLMRSKEDARDYRYFPEPDLMPLQISKQWLEEIRAKQPELPREKKARFEREYQIPQYDIEILTASRKLADLFEETAGICKDAKKASNWIMGEAMRLLKERSMEPEEIKLIPQNLAALIALLEKKEISNTVAKEIFEVIFAEDINPAEYAEEKGLKIQQDEAALKKQIETILSANGQSVKDYLSGKERAMGYLVGQTMKAMQGKADPNTIKKILKRMLQL